MKKLDNTNEKFRRNKMIVSEKLQNAINQQIANELGASIQYIHIASYFENEDLHQFAGIFFTQSDEERFHATKFVHYLLDANVSVDIPAIPKSTSTFKSAKEAVGAALAWEEEVTRQINNLMDIAVSDKDYISQDFLRWYVTEQLEEISKMSTILGTLEKAGDNLLLAEQVVVQNLPTLSSAATSPSAPAA
jgi:ferritin